MVANISAAARAGFQLHVTFLVVWTKPQNFFSQSIQVNPGFGPSNPASRPGTSGASYVEHRHTYPPIAPVSESVVRQHDAPQASPQSAMPTPSRALGMQNILNPSESGQPETRAGGSGSGLAYLPPPLASPRSRKRPGPRIANARTASAVAICNGKTSLDAEVSRPTNV